jgi:ribosomal 30S subunit maturation factor RimM
LRQFVLKNKEREKKNKQIECEIKEKRKAKKNYSQKLKTIRDREKMIKYFNEQRIIARVKNVDRAA